MHLRLARKAQKELQKHEGSKLRQDLRTKDRKKKRCVLKEEKDAAAVAVGENGATATLRVNKEFCKESNTVTRRSGRHSGKAVAG